MRTIKVGLDIGNSTVKGSVLNAQNGLLREIFIPSAVNYISDKKYLDFPLATTRYVRVINSPLKHSDNIVAIGDRAMDIPNYRQFEVGNNARKTNNDITTALLFGILGELVYNETEIAITLAVSIPIEEYNHITSEGTKLFNDYAKLLTGVHDVQVYTPNGIHDVKIHITRTEVLSEGQAGFFGIMDTLDASFHNTMANVLSQVGESFNSISLFDNFLVVDIGEGTTDIATFRNKHYNKDFSHSITKGYGTLLEQAMAKAEREGLTVESRKQLQSLLSSTNERRRAQKERWMAYVGTERKDYIDELVQKVLKAYGRQSEFDSIIFLGGGFTALTGYRLDENNKIVMDDGYMFEILNKALSDSNKTSLSIFGVPAPYSQSINNRGLMQRLVYI